MSDEHEPDEQALRDADDAITDEVDAWAEAETARAAEIMQRVKHSLAALRVAGVPLDCLTADALRSLADAIQAIIHEALDES